MKRKKTKKNRKKSNRRRKIIYSIYILLASLSLFFFFKAYQYISNIPKANNITQEEIYDLTRIGATDIKLVRALKNDAFDSWLYEANDDKVKKLKKTEEMILSITEGKVKLSSIDRAMADLKKRVDTISAADTEELYGLYYKKVLPKQYEKADTAFQAMNVEQPEENYKEIFTLLDLLNKIYDQKGMHSITNEESFKESVSLLEEINHNFVEVNKIKEMFVNYDTLNTPIPEPETRLGKELDEYVFKVNDYLQSTIIVTEFEKKYSELKFNLSENKELIDKSVDVPDLVGMTVEQARRELRKIKLDMTLQGYTNKMYRNGERVPEIQKKIEEWDGDKQDRIIRQDPSSVDYDYIIEGSTIRITVENKPTEKPAETPDSSSSSTSDSSTSTSDSTKETSSTTENKDHTLNE